MVNRREQILRGYPVHTRPIPLLRYSVVVYGLSIRQGLKICLNYFTMLIYRALSDYVHFRLPFLTPAPVSAA